MNSLPSLVLRPTPATATSQEPELDIANIPDLFRGLAPIGSSALRKPAFIYPMTSDLEVEDPGGDAVESKDVQMPPPATAQASSKNLRPSEPATTIENSSRKDESGWDNRLTDSSYASAVHQGSQSSLHINSSASGNSRVNHPASSPTRSLSSISVRHVSNLKAKMLDLQHGPVDSWVDTSKLAVFISSMTGKPKTFFIVNYKRVSGRKCLSRLFEWIISYVHISETKCWITEYPSPRLSSIMELSHFFRVPKQSPTQGHLADFTAKWTTWGSHTNCPVHLSFEASSILKGLACLSQIAEHPSLRQHHSYALGPRMKILGGSSKGINSRKGPYGLTKTLGSFSPPEIPCVSNNHEEIFSWLQTLPSCWRWSSN